MNRLVQLIDNWKRVRVMVVGDFMLDQSVYGNAERLSPDAPVPVLSIEREQSQGGGAANVSLNLAALKCEVHCVGMVGEDEAGEQLIGHLQKAGCDTGGMLKVKGRPTTVKRSYVGLAQHRHPQKMFRVDHECREPIGGEVEGRFVEIMEKKLGAMDVVCIEDYDKGLLTGSMCQKLIEMAKERGLAVMVDPAAIGDYGKYRGATVITPNRTEAQRATGMTVESGTQIEEAARVLMEKVELEVVVLTLDRHGALLLERGCEAVQVPTVARNVYDVSGAGDMVLACLAGGIGNGSDWRTAVELANLAAGLEVEQFGVVPIPLEDVHMAALMAHRHEQGKLRTARELVTELGAYRKQGKKVAFTNGCFDILHAGHVEMLRGARATADLLVLAVNSDVSIRKLKGKDRPIVGEVDRIKVLSELECVDYIVLFGDGSGTDADTPRPLLAMLKPEVLVKGGQYAHDQVVGWEIVEGYGGKIVTIDHVEGRSTTNIVDRIKASG